MSVYREYETNPNTFWVSPNSPYINLYNAFNSYIEQDMANALRGKSTEFFKGADVYMTESPNGELLQAFGKLGYDRVSAVLTQANVKNPEKILDNLTLNYYALFALAEDITLVGVDLSVADEKKWYPTALYTRSKHILEVLDKNGQLENPDWAKIDKNLTAGKTLTGLKDGLLPLLRLDPVSSEGGKPIFKVSVPQKNLNAGASRDVAILPVFAYITFTNLLKQFSQQTPFRFETTSIIGTKAYNVALSPNVFSQVYQHSGFELEDIKRKLNKSIVGFDITTQRIYAYDIEASFHEHGVISFRPEMLDAIRPLGANDLDLSRHKINYPVLRLVYGTKIRALKAGDVKKITFLDMSSYANLKDAQEGLLLHGEKLSNRNLYALMQQNPQIFGNIEEEVANREKRTLKVLRDLEMVDLPTASYQRKVLVDNLLKSGVVRITAKRKTSNSVLEVLASNNEHVLRQTLGKDYKQKFETTRVRLWTVRDMIASGQIASRTDLEKSLIDFNIGDVIDLQNFLNVDYSTGDFTNALMEIERAIKELQEKAKARNISETNVLYRNVNAEDQSRLYGNVEAGNIIAIEYKEYK